MWIENKKSYAQIRLLSRFSTKLLASGVSANAVGLLAASFIHDHCTVAEGCVLCFFLLFEAYIAYVITNVILQIMAER